MGSQIIPRRMMQYVAAAGRTHTSYARNSNEIIYEIQYIVPISSINPKLYADISTNKIEMEKQRKWKNRLLLK